MRGNCGLIGYKIARNYLTYMLDFIVMQMSKVNHEKGYSVREWYLKFTQNPTS